MVLLNMNDIINDEIPTTKRGLHFAHLNVQSIRNKFDLFKIYVTKLGFDVFTFSESWLTKDMDDCMLSIPGYNLVRLDRSWSNEGEMFPKRGGGIGAYIKNNINYSLQNISQYNTNCPNVEALWLELHFENCKNIILGIIYRPPGGKVRQFCDYIVDTSNNLATFNNKEIFLLGDFNIKYGKLGDDAYKCLIEFEQFTNFSQLIKDPTRLDNTIDLIYTNSSHISQAGVLDILLSDHNLIYCTRKKIPTKFTYAKYEGRSYRNYDPIVLQNFMSTLDWTQFWEFDNPGDCWKFIINKVEYILNVMCPIKLRSNRINNNPWLSDEILECIREKNVAWKRAKKSGSPQDLETARILRNRVKTIIRRAKSDFVQDYLENDIISLKKFWEKINLLMPTNGSSNTIQLVDTTTNQPVPINDVPDFINNFFTEIGPELAKKFTRFY